jgi:hypothetical protein
VQIYAKALKFRPLSQWYDPAWMCFVENAVYNHHYSSAFVFLTSPVIGKQDSLAVIANLVLSLTKPPVLDLTTWA